jgi:menaquinone-dependent protoporphyrinogen oxidase
MKTLIAYATSHGSVGLCAEKLSAQLGGETIVVDLKKDKAPDLAGFEAIIVGGSIHAGKIQKAVQSFCASHLAELKAKKLGLFLCHMEEGEKAEAEFRASYPAELIEQAAATGLFGGIFDFDKMNFLERAIIKKISGVTETIVKIREDEIGTFAEKMKA